MHFYASVGAPGDLSPAAVLATAGARCACSSAADWGSFEPTQVLSAALDGLTLPPLPAGVVAVLPLPEWEEPVGAGARSRPRHLWRSISSARAQLSAPASRRGGRGGGQGRRLRTREARSRACGPFRGEYGRGIAVAGWGARSSRRCSPRQSAGALASRICRSRRAMARRSRSTAALVSPPCTTTGTVPVRASRTRQLRQCASTTISTPRPCVSAGRARA